MNYILIFRLLEHTVKGRSKNFMYSVSVRLSPCLNDSTFAQCREKNHRFFEQLPHLYFTHVPIGLHLLFLLICCIRRVYKISNNKGAKYIQPHLHIARTDTKQQPNWKWYFIYKMQLYTTTAKIKLHKVT